MPVWVERVMEQRNAARNTACLVIQRAWREHARRKVLGKSSSGTHSDAQPHIALPGLDEKRRAELSERLRWERHPRGMPLPPKTQEEAHAAHSKGQAAYARIVSARRTAIDGSARRRALLTQTEKLRKDLQRDLALDLDTLVRNAVSGRVAQSQVVDARVRTAAAERHRDMLRRRDAPWWSVKPNGESASSDWESGLPDVSMTNMSGVEARDDDHDDHDHDRDLGHGTGRVVPTVTSSQMRTTAATASVR